MSEEPESESSLLTANLLRLVYVAGIALNTLALAAAVRAGQTLAALTLGVVIVYLCLRYWMVVRS